MFSLTFGNVPSGFAVPGPVRHRDDADAAVESRQKFTLIAGIMRIRADRTHNTQSQQNCHCLHLSYLFFISNHDGCAAGIADAPTVDSLTLTFHTVSTVSSTASLSRRVAPLSKTSLRLHTRGALRRLRTLISSVPMSRSTGDKRGRIRDDRHVASVEWERDRHHRQRPHRTRTTPVQARQ